MNLAFSASKGISRKEPTSIKSALRVFLFKEILKRPVSKKRFLNLIHPSLPD
jgi:hypothetical protein